MHAFTYIITYVHICIHIYTYAYTHTHMHIHIWVKTYSYTHIRKYICILNIHITCIYISIAATQWNLNSLLWSREKRCLCSIRRSLVNLRKYRWKVENLTWSQLAHYLRKLLVQPLKTALCTILWDKYISVYMSLTQSPPGKHNKFTFWLWNRCSFQ